MRNLTPDEQLVVILAALVLGCAWITAGSWWALSLGIGRHARNGAEPVSAEVFAANIRRALIPPPPVTEITTVLPAVPETTSIDVGPVVPGFARAIPAPSVAPPTDPHGIALAELPPLRSGSGPGHGALPYRGDVPVQRTWSCSFCHDGDLRTSRAGQCPWCGTQVKHVNGAVR